jgi:cytochrome c biogenesis protein CcdA
MGELSNLLSGFTGGVLKALSNFSLLIGLIFLLLAMDRFKRRAETSQQSTLSIVILYLFFATVLITFYFLT